MSGKALKAIDPLGLCENDGSGGCTGTTGPGPDNGAEGQGNIRNYGDDSGAPKNAAAKMEAEAQAALAAAYEREYAEFHARREIAMAREEAQRAGKAGISDASFDVADATARERGNAGITAMGQTTPLAPLVVSLQAATGNNDAAPVANSIAMLGMGVRASPRPAPSRSMSMSGGSAKGGSIPPAMAMSGGASGARGPPSIRSRIRDAGLPGGGQHSGPFRYRPPEGYKPGDPLPRGPGGGYLDRFGNEWQKGPYHGDPKKPFTYEWDVQLSQTGRNNFRRHELGEKGYVDIRPDGFLSH